MLAIPKENSVMSDFVTVAKVGEIPAGEGKTIVVNGRLIALLRDGDNYFALDDTCPHMGASLGAGYVTDGAVYCPWHAWRFSICDGTWLDSLKSKVRCTAHEVRVQGEEIQIKLSSSSTQVETDGTSLNP